MAGDGLVEELAQVAKRPRRAAEAEARLTVTTLERERMLIGGPRSLEMHAGDMLRVDDMAGFRELFLRE